MAQSTMAQSSVSRVNRIRKPVKRQGAETHLVYMLLSFACTVILIRLFLSLTGYPQVGGGGLHIAHMLWGGLLLFAASLLPMVLSNRWVYTVGAVMSGIGVGLFIDEVGKFITQNNDYFYPAAAPIIYAFFLLTVLLYLQVRRRKLRDARAELYAAMEAMEEVLDHDLDSKERSALENRLGYIVEQARHPDTKRLADTLRSFLNSGAIDLVPHHTPYWVLWLKRAQRFRIHWITQTRFRIAIVLGMVVFAVVALGNLVTALSVMFDPGGVKSSEFGRLVADYAKIDVSGALGRNLLIARLVMQGVEGLLLLVSAGLLLWGRIKHGLAFGYYGLLVSLTTVNLLVFYFDQFVAIIGTLIQFGLLMCVNFYRRIFVDRE